MVFVALAACSGGDEGAGAADAGGLPDAGADAGAPDAGPVRDAGADAGADAGKLWTGWLKGDLHMHTTHSDGSDDVASTIRIAEYFAHPALVARHPEYEGRGLDFIAITDHRTVAATLDPAFVSEKLLLLGAEEYGSDGHANTLGITTHVSHEPVGAETPTEAIQRGIGETHAQGGAFSVNHPLSAGDFWAWDVSGYDAAEIWNGYWGGAMDMVPEEDVNLWEERHGSVNPVIRLAMAWTESSLDGVGFFEANLSAGRFIAPVGGSDRHMIFMPGYPTTWVRAEEGTVGGIIEGIRARHTIVTRSPAAAMAGLTADAGGTAMMAGDVGTFAAGIVADVSVRVTGASGGRVELVEGVVLDETLVLDVAAVPAPAVVATLDVPSNDATVSWTWAPSRPSWLYARVLEKIDLTDYAPRTKEWLADYFSALESVAAAGKGGAGEMVSAFLPFTDMGASKADCAPEKTPEWRVECIPGEVTQSGTFFIPEHLARPFSAVVRGGKVTEYAIGGITSALVLR
jgi:hypothetical protein